MYLWLKLYTVPFFVSEQTYTISKGSNNYSSHCIWVIHLCPVLRRIFLQDLEGCLDTPERVGACFLERVRLDCRMGRMYCRCVWICFEWDCAFLSHGRFPCNSRKRISRYMNVTVRTNLARSHCGGSGLIASSSRYSVRSQKYNPNSNEVGTLC